MENNAFSTYEVVETVTKKDTDNSSTDENTNNKSSNNSKTTQVADKSSSSSSSKSTSIPATGDEKDFLFSGVFALLMMSTGVVVVEAVKRKFFR